LESSRAEQCFSETIPGGYVVRDANGQAIAYIYSRETEAEALQAKVLTADEARRIAIILRQAQDRAVARPELVDPSTSARGCSGRASAAKVRIEFPCPAIVLAGDSRDHGGQGD
jgi:hypothetical protein